MSDVTDLIERLRVQADVSGSANDIFHERLMTQAADALERINRPADDVVEDAVNALHPAWFTSDFNYREAQKAVRTALASIKQTDAVDAERRALLPPDGIDAQECLSRIFHHGV